MGLKRMAQSLANGLGYEIRRLPPGMRAMATPAAGAAATAHPDTGTGRVPASLQRLSVGELAALVARVAYFQHKIDLVAAYQRQGGWYELRAEPAAAAGVFAVLAQYPAARDWVAAFQPSAASATEARAALVAERVARFRRIHFGCGANYFEGWLNVDFGEHAREDYLRINLCEQMPLPDAHFDFAYSEDFLEHIQQSDSLIFLAEARRVLRPGGVARLSFPGLEGVLRKHYLMDEDMPTYQGKFDAYEYWDHVHFYSREELRLVALHLGFREVTFHAFGESPHPELRGIDTREHQRDLNTYAELSR